MARKAVVIGAGVIGVASAYALARRGWQVVLLDREEGPAMGASHSNGAQLSYCFTDALGSPATFAALPRLVMGRGGVSFRLDARPDYLAWLLAFARNCTFGRFRENTLATYALAQESRTAMEALCENHDLDFRHHVAGKVYLLYTDRDKRRAETVRTLKRKAGCEQHYVPREELAQLDPALVGLDPEVTGAISTPSEVVGDALLFCRALRFVLEREYGMVSHFGSEVRSVDQGEGGALVTLASGETVTGDVAVIAGGSDSNRLLAPRGERAMIEAMKGYSFEIPATACSPHISVTDSKRRLVFTRLGEKVRVAGIAELGNASREIEPDRIAWLIDAARDCLPDGGDYSRPTREWAGLRPMTPDTQPIIRRAGPSLAINTGHGALGWTLAMGSGERLADLLDQS